MKTSVFCRRNIFLILFTLIIFLTTGFKNQAFGLIDTVYVYNNQFSTNPPGGPIENPLITIGDTVRWVWIQGGHTTTSVSGSLEVWDSVIDQNNVVFDHQFTLSGTFWYYCQPHGNDNGDGTADGMSGYITVLEAGSGACCLEDGTCFVTSEGNCLSSGGNFQGLGSTCEDISCPAESELEALKDNTIYNETLELNNGAGDNLWVGLDNQDDQRRSLISFDLSSIPSNAIITSAVLQLRCNQGNNTALTVHVHKLIQDWGEGTSQGGGSEIGGGAVSLGSSTWNYTFYDTDLWNTPGGDYELASSASTTVTSKNTWYAWASSTLTADVQSWVADPSSNYGWILIGNETPGSTSKSFSSKDNTEVDQRPYLSVEYVVPVTGACCMPDGSCSQYSESGCAVNGGIYQGDGTSCSDVYCTVVLTPYLDELPLPAVAEPVTGSPGTTAHYDISFTEQMQQLHAELPMTRTWGYAGTYPGPTIEALNNDTVTIQWHNDIRVAETGLLRIHHALNVDTCLHGPHLTGDTVVSIVHLHGGKVPPESDGYPDLAFPPGESAPLYTYPNDQPAATLWYHDHGLGITRLNVMMGMAGFYIIRDSVEQSLGLPDGPHEVPLVIQDRSFNADGSFYYPDHYVDHFFGDKNLVNGKVWPYLNVDQGKYRFRVLNGANSRTYNLSLSDGSTFWLIATDLGLVETPVALTEITLLSGERAELIIDFSGYAPGTEILLRNDAPAPYPGFPGVGVVSDVIKFIVGSNTGYTDPIPNSLASVPAIPESEAVIERDFDLALGPPSDCGENPHGTWMINGLMWDDITEFPELGTTEIWSWINNSGMSHPMHMHLVKFQILDRIPIDANGNPTGPPEPPGAHETGWKDTVDSPPGYKTRVIARFEGYTGLFPYHCHILEHEDHEMMRQFQVVKSGCTDQAACNYDPIANIDDGSCLLPGDLCNDNDPSTENDQLDENCVCSGTPICADPFPAVSESSLSTTFQGSSYLVGWEPVAGQIGCQVQARFAGLNILGSAIVSGANAGSFIIPGSVLSFGTDYEWRVRCGCSQNPLVAGPWSGWQGFTTPSAAKVSTNPNPTDGLTAVTFKLGNESFSTLEVFDMNGRVIGTLFHGMASPNAEYRFEFDGSNLPNGIYLFRLTTHSQVITQKFMISK